MNKDKKQLKFINKNIYKKDRQKPYFEEYYYYMAAPAVWMHRNSVEHQLCEGYWLLVHGTRGPFEKLFFTAASHHWVPVWYKNFPDEQVAEFQVFMDQNKIHWR